jgi:hypothetical protein
MKRAELKAELDVPDGNDGYGVHSTDATGRRTGEGVDVRRKKGRKKKVVEEGRTEAPKALEIL